MSPDRERPGGETGAKSLAGDTSIMPDRSEILARIRAQLPDAAAARRRAEWGRRKQVRRLHAAWKRSAKETRP